MEVLARVPQALTVIPNPAKESLLKPVKGTPEYKKMAFAFKKLTRERKKKKKR